MSSHQLLCKFHERGHCREGSSCQFSHNVSTAIKIPNQCCWYYLQSRCMYDDSCRFLHMKPAEIISLHSFEIPLEQSSPSNQSSLSSSSQSSTSHHGTRQSSKDSGFDYFEMNESLDTSKPHGDGTNDPNHHTDYGPNGSNHNEYGPNHMDNGPHLNDGLNDQEEPYDKPRIADDELISIKSYSQVVLNNLDQDDSFNDKDYDKLIKLKELQLNEEELAKIDVCPFAIASLDGQCPYLQNGYSCDYVHGMICDLCGQPVVHPYNEQKRKEHREECIREHEKEMELSFAIQRSSDKQCGICMDMILEKEPPNERRFGILEKCNHVFCLSCIRKWRQTKQFDNRTIRACPECRVSSDFVIPSKYWYESKEDKDQLINSYKEALSTKHCKYFKKGEGECPFAGACFYLHEYPDGRKADRQPPRTRRRQNQDGQIETWRADTNFLLWNLIEDRNESSAHFLFTLNFDEEYDDFLNEYFSDDTDDDSVYLNDARDSAFDDN